MELRTKRLLLTPLGEADVDAFHALVVDAHVRRYLLDGQVLPRAWAEEQVSRSQALFTARGAGLWLARLADTGEVAGFTGLVDLGAAHGPELVYALPERFTGRGLAREMAAAVLAHLAAVDPGGAVHASVDAVNGASVRVLEALGFAPVEEREGAFGVLRVYRRGPL
jgi:RimJ/RimL family protein N-acetyltransferase